MKKMFALTVLSLLFVCTFAHAQSFAGTGTTTLQLTIGPEAAISIDSSSSTTAMSSSTTDFSTPFTGTTNFTYKIRTKQSGGTGSVTAKVTSDFTAVANGPSVANNTLTYTCAVAAPGSACSGTQTASTSTATSVASFGTDAHSAGDTGSVAWSLPSDPVYPTGSYSATVMFTISAA